MRIMLAVALAASLAAPAFAQRPMPDGMKMPDDGDAPGGAPADRGALMRSMEKMHRDMMSAPMTGDPDRDFTAMMIPHHQGAVDMAKSYLRDGRDPQMRKLARSIVADQEREIAVMRRWQANHPGP